ncbi:phospholipase A2 [Streptomyces pseudovenezuelae]|uniref:phospholipase A2 n=1 Tax=Streptomyces pseudovenezuelae TaxID=67350 RepID=UPI0034A5714F
MGHRHDFGYRNYRLQDRFTKENKERIDDNFRDEYVFFFLFPVIIVTHMCISTNHGVAFTISVILFRFRSGLSATLWHKSTGLL